MPEVEHRRLGEAADDLVGARDHEVRARRERVLGQLLVEGQMGAPRLVDDQGHIAGVGDLGEGPDVGDGAEVGRRDHPRAHRAGGHRQRAVERLRRQAMGDAELGIQLRRGERGSQAGQHERVDRARVRVALQHDLVAVVGERQAGREVALRGAVDQKPRPRCAPRVGREPLGPLERGRL